jgi:predicted nucleotidyltransferase
MNCDSIELLAAFIRENIRYLIVGGYAVSFHAEPRYTKDLDILIATTPENARALFRTLGQFGVPLQDVTPEDFENKELFFMIGAPPNRIDILMGIPGIDFEQAWKNRVEADIEGVTISYISREDLIASKRAAGRDQDLLDIKMLEQAGRFTQRRNQLE